MVVVIVVVVVVFFDFVVPNLLSLLSKFVNDSVILVLSLSLYV